MVDPTAWIPEALEAVAFRLARADECAYEVGDMVSSWASSNPVQIYQTLEGDIVTSKVESIRPIPPKIAMLFSEAINHIRSSLDNVVWALVIELAGEIAPGSERLVEFPITRNPNAFSNWCKKRSSNGLPMFEESSDLSRRLRSLQHWQNSATSVPSVSEALAVIRKRPVEYANALLLLQKYSNNDKHRSIQLAVHQSVVTTYDVPIWEQDLSFRAIEPGTVIRKSKLGSSTIMELNPAAVLIRPAPFSDEVNPAKEINALRKYVSEIAVPTLVRGLANAYQIPPEINLADTGATHRERLQQAGWDDSIDRLVPLLANRFEVAMTAEVEVARHSTSE